MHKKFLATVAICAFAILAGIPVQAAKAELNADVPAGKWKTLRLRNLPKDASVGLRVESSGPIRVIFLHQDELRRFPKPVRPAFVGTAERRLSIRVTVPLAGSYYVILDNRKGSAAREVRVLIEAVAPRRAEPKPKPSPSPIPNPKTPGLNTT
jgi:hypothetical protein